jgi:hypothetical protein
VPFKCCASIIIIILFIYFKELVVLDLPCFTNVEKPLDNKGLQKEFLNGKTCAKGSYLICLNTVIIEYLGFFFFFFFLENDVVSRVV